MSVIVLLILNISATSWQAATLVNDVNNLKSRPDMTERVIRLEAVTDEHKRVLTDLSMVLTRIDGTIDRIAAEQNRRTGTIEWLKRQRNGSEK